MNTPYTLPLPLVIQGVQTKTEIGGFTAIGAEDQPCTAYCAGAMEAAAIVHACNSEPALRAALEGLMAEHDHADSYKAAWEAARQALAL
jgi:hypothetical protein